jgi:hypothetical protein
MLSLPRLKPWAIKKFQNDGQFEMKFISQNLNNGIG